MPRAAASEPSQSVWSERSHTQTQSFEPLKHMQTQLIQLPRFGSPKKLEATDDRDEKAKAAGLQAKMAKKKRLEEKGAPGLMSKDAGRYTVHDLPALQRLAGPLQGSLVHRWVTPEHRLAGR